MSNVYPNLEIAGNKIVSASGRKLAKISDFAHDYSNTPTESGAIVDVPIISTEAKDFNEISANYGNVDGTYGVAKINVDDHLVAGFQVSQKQLSDGLGAFKDLFTRMGEDAGRAIAKKVEADVFGLLTATSSEFSAATPTNKAGFLTLWEELPNNDLDAEDCVLVLNPTLYSKALDVCSDIANLERVIEQGYIDNFLGFKRVICTKALPTGVNGAILGPNAIGLANRTLDFDGEAYTALQTYTDDASGLSITLLVFTDPNTGKKKVSATALFGKGIIRKEEIILLK